MDIPQLMIQANAWPMEPQRGVECVPCPSTGDGVVTAPWDAAAADASVTAVWRMLHELKQGDASTPGHGLGEHWHPNAPWYGPAGIGSAEGHDGIVSRSKSLSQRLSDNTRHLEDGVFFGDQDMVAFTGWPSGTAVHSGEFSRSGAHRTALCAQISDFWRVEDGRIRENWVMVDMLDLIARFDVLKRMNGNRRGEHAA